MAKVRKKKNSKEDKALVIIMHLQGKNYDFVSMNWIAEITRALSFKQEHFFGTLEAAISPDLNSWLNSLV